MLRSVKELYNYILAATDAEIGRCKDFLFDDDRWVIRYMVADAGKWLPGKRVLISPIALGEPDWRTRRFPVLLEKRKIEAAPHLDEDAPVSRQYEQQWFQHYGWPGYWTGTGLWGTAEHPGALFPPMAVEPAPAAHTRTPEDNTRLRSTKEVGGYHLQAQDGKIGHIDDFIVNDREWIIRYLVVDTRNWLPGRKVLVPPTWLADVDWAHWLVKVDLSREDIQNSPEYDPHAPVNREYEVRLYDYYGRPKYWG